MKDFPLISAAALIYWGLNTGNLTLSLIFAILFETAGFVKFRFDFKENDFNNISIITTLSLAGFIMYFINSNQNTGVISALIMFLPVSLLPLNFFFLYSTSPTINAKRLFLLFVINKYSVVSSYMRNFRPDYLFLASLILGGSVKMKSGSIYLLYTIILLIISRFKSKNHSYTRFLVQSISVIILAIIVQTGIFSTYILMRDVLADIYIERFMKFRSKSMNVGSIGKMKDSYIIDVRVKNYDPRPWGLLIRDRVFNGYMNGIWTDSETGKKELTLYNDLYSNQSMDSLRIFFFSKGNINRIRMPFGTFDFGGLEVNKLNLNSLGNLTYGYTQYLIDYKTYVRNDSTLNIFGDPDENDLRFNRKDSVYTDGLIDSLALKGIDPSSVFRILSNHFISEYTYSLDYIFLKDNEKMKHFAETKKGHCELFATLTALIFRRLGYPSRYVTGYLITEYDSFGGVYLGRRKDRHAWVQVWEKGKGWLELDPTPPDISGSFENRSIFGKVYDIFSNMYFSFFTFKKENSELYQKLLLYSLIPLGLFLAFRIFKDVKISKSSREDSPDIYGKSEELRIIEEKLRPSGNKPGNETVGSWFINIIKKHDHLSDSFSIVKKLYYGKRYGNKEMNEPEKKEFNDHTDKFTDIK